MSHEVKIGSNGGISTKHEIIGVVKTASQIRVFTKVKPNSLLRGHDVGETDRDTARDPGQTVN